MHGLTIEDGAGARKMHDRLIRRVDAPGQEEVDDQSFVTVRRVDAHGLVGPVRRRIVGRVDAPGQRSMIIRIGSLISFKHIVTDRLDAAVIEDRRLHRLHERGEGFRIFSVASEAQTVRRAAVHRWSRVGLEEHVSR